MDTSAGYYQAPRPPRVPLDEVLIKLHPEGFHQGFEADGINVGTGGISMRASVLPQVGSTLRCQLDNPVGGEAIEMIGRVVWAHERGEHAGEFGIRFTHLSDEDQVRIEALIQRWGRTSAVAPTVRLQLDGVDSSIVAELRSESESSLMVEQPLPFLAIGSAMRNACTGRRGHLEAVELRMDERTPKLVLSIGYAPHASSEVVVETNGERDTMPDAPPVVRTSTPTEEARLHDTPRIVRYDAEAREARKPTLGERVGEYAQSAKEGLSVALNGARTALLDDLVPGVRGRAHELFALVVRFVGALRERLDDKPRRKQVPRSHAARAHLKNTRRSRRRYALLGVMIGAIVAAGWGIYAWAASEAVSDAATGVARKEDAARPPQASGAGPSATKTKADRAPIAIQGAPLPPESVRGAAFGAESVAGGEKYVLRMSNPVNEMDGIVEDDGFSVTIPGSLSLSRAGPIAAAHPDVEHASILNRGDFSELTIRFVAGRRPLYRVEARGPAIEITIAR